MSLPQHLQISNPHLVDQLNFMREQESTHYCAPDDYFRILPSSHPSSRRSKGDNAEVAVTPSDRRTMVSWSYDIADACSSSREVAVVCSSYFDRFMCTASPSARAALSSRREFQLVYIACLIIALKCRAGMQVDPDFVSETVCRGLYKEEEINATEGEVLAALGWRLNGPSPHEFVEGMAELLPSHLVNSEVAEGLRTLAKERAEAAALEYPSALRDASSVAYEALMTAMDDDEVASAFRPLDRLAWMRNMAEVIGVGASDYGECNVPFAVVSHQSSLPFDDIENLYDNVMRYSNVPRSGARFMGGYKYCSPVSESDPSMRREDCYDEPLYMNCSPVTALDPPTQSGDHVNDLLHMDLLSLSIGMSNDFSPICTVEDRR